MTATHPATGLAILQSSSAIETLRTQIAPKASNEELAYFAQVCTRLELSPFADQIVLIGRYDKRVDREVYRHQITVAGRRTLATRTGNLVGIEGPVWSGPRVRGELVWQEMWDDDDNPPYCARVLVHVRGWVVPANGTAKWSEFAQTTRNGDLLPLWKKMPANMLGKCAESLALRRAFPDTITADVVGGFDATIDPDAAELVEAVADDPVSARAVTAGAAEPEPARADTPTYVLRPGDQAIAHRAIGELTDSEKRAFLDRWKIEQFESTWPDDAVIDALEQPF